MAHPSAQLTRADGPARDWVAGTVSSDQPLVVRTASTDDGAAIAAGYIAVFGNRPLASFGAAFAELYFRGLLGWPHALGFVALDEKGSLAGFAVGARDSRAAHRALLKRHAARLALLALGATIRRPSLLPSLMRGLTLERRQPPAATTAFLSAIAVLPPYRGRGVGALLLDSFLSRSGMVGATHVALEVDRGEEAVVAMYRSAGFEWAASPASSDATSRTGEMLLDLSHWSPRAAARREP